MKLIKATVIVVLTVLVATVGTKRFAEFRRDQSTKKCVENLRRIDGATQQWALENYATENAMPTWFDIYFYGGRDCDDWPAHCPSGGFYVIGRVGGGPQCSISNHTVAFQAHLPGVKRSNNTPRTPLIVTRAYQEEIRRLMIAEAEHIARDLKLEEQLPITTNNKLRRAAIPEVIIRGRVGGFETANYNYTMGLKDGGVVVSGISWINQADRSKLWSKANHYDTNQLVQIANELLARAGIDIEALQHDCVVSVDPWFREFHHLADPFHTVAWRQRQDTFSFREGHVMATITFAATDKLMDSFGVSNCKYILRGPLKTLDMAGLLTPENSREAVLDEVQTATNYVKRIRQLQVDGAQESVLRQAWLDYSTEAFPTNLLSADN